MFIKVEPAEFFMYRVILVFDLENPNSEDQDARDYMTEWELEPKYQRIGDFEGSNSEIMQFGGCYLGRHLGKISEIQRGHVEREIITAEIGRLLDDEGDPVPVPDDRREQTCPGAGSGVLPAGSLSTQRRGVARGGARRLSRPSGCPRDVGPRRVAIQARTPLVSGFSWEDNGAPTLNAGAPLFCCRAGRRSTPAAKYGAGDGNRTHMASLEG